MRRSLLFLFIFLSFFITFADYSLQIGSFKTEKRAIKAKHMYSKKLKKEFLYITKAKIPNKGTWFRVKYGRFKNKEKALLVLQELKNQKIPVVLTTFPQNKTLSYFFQQNEEVKTEIPSQSQQTKTTINTSTNTVIKSNNASDTMNSINITEKIDDIKLRDQQFLFKLKINNTLLIKYMKNDDMNSIPKLIQKYKQLLSEYFDVPDLYQAYYMISRCYLFINNINKAIQFLSKSIQFAPKSEKASILYEMGFLQYVYLRNYDLAIDTFKKVSIEYPNTEWALLAQKSINEILKFKIYNVE